MDHLQLMLIADFLPLCIKSITFNLLVIPIELNPQYRNLFHHFMPFYLVTEKVIMNHCLQYNLIYIKLTKNSS